MKVPSLNKKPPMTEKEIQTEREQGSEFTGKIAQLELQIEELQELNFERERAI
jgi:peptidoglycan hydrolase CwlO-like protein